MSDEPRLPEPGTILLEDQETDVDEDLWTDDTGADHSGWYCVATNPFPCPAEGCDFVAEHMTAAHLILVWEESDDPNLLRREGGRSQPARRQLRALTRPRATREGGRSQPARRQLRALTRAERLLLRVGGCWAPCPRDSQEAHGLGQGRGGAATYPQSRASTRPFDSARPRISRWRVMLRASSLKRRVRYSVRARSESSSSSS